MTRSTPWFKLDCRAWLDATRNLPPDVRGQYIDVLALIYDRDGPIPDDDKWMAHQLHVSPRKWRSARDTLVACGKLVSCDGRLNNPRAALEIEQRAEIRRINAENAAKRGRDVTGKTEKCFRNNDGDHRTGQRKAAYAHARDNQSHQKEESCDSENMQLGIDCDGANRPTQQLAARAASPMWRKAELGWLVEAIPKFARDDRDLRNWLANLETQYGPEALSVAIAQAKPYVEAGGVPNVQGYITGIIRKIKSAAGQHRGLQ